MVNMARDAHDKKPLNIFANTKEKKIKYKKLKKKEEEEERKKIK